MAAPAGTAPMHYILDKRASKFTVRAYAGGMLSALGHNPTIAIRDFSGEALFSPAAPQQATLRVEIRADSLEVVDDISSKDRKEMEAAMNQQVLESSKYSTIVFEGKATTADPMGGERYRVALNGSLTLRGNTRSVPLTAQVALTGDLLRASGEFSIRQSDYSIPLVSVAGGAMKLKDELKFSYDIVARKQARKQE
jgi:polyisoprenoid-binding protein YceI